ncbi:hypothetical protein EJ110_NYTH52988 [Nymphaea thermarum]|nr:hypothetical protein EJ110_NYTH52988 [Nymphaea thermarum]
MKTYINVKGFVKGVRPPRVRSQERQVQIGFLLKDILKVFGDDEDEDEISMSQCCYEQQIISMSSSQFDNMDRVKEMIYQTLHGHMDMDPQSAETAAPDVASTIRDLIQSAGNTNPPNSTILLEVHVECTIEKAEGETDEPRGEHGYARLVERFDDEVCGICHQELSSLWDMDITTCHHAYHHSCLLRWLYRGTRTCPICRSNLAPMILTNHPHMITFHILDEPASL